ncbi:MAG: hypothetical protein LBL94_05610 [Prevotellaceae bacterium]|jgi:hypothetical protein|nr:hypothetical protein [Prevotellaceae bacterium]
MDAKQYILKELSSLVAKFSNIRVRYEYDERAEVHCVEVVPKEVYYSNDAYISWEIDVTSRFIKHFPTENIGFISDDDLMGIENAAYVSAGKNYAPAHRKAKAQTMEYA